MMRDRFFVSHSSAREKKVKKDGVSPERWSDDHLTLTLFRERVNRECLITPPRLVMTLSK